MQLLKVPSIICTLAVFFASARAEQKSENCSEVRIAYSSKGFNLNDVPNQGVNGAHLKVCPQDFSCCTLEMEQKLSQQSCSDLKASVSQQSASLKSTFTQRHRHFDRFFRELLDNSQRSLHEMFKHTYGMMYMKNAELFQHFFRDLKRYYAYGSAAINLDSMLVDFWAELLERMFKLVNVQYELSDSYMDCVSRYTDELKPFGDVPRKLRLQLTRTFIAARTFTRGLRLLPEVVDKVSMVRASPACERAAMKMLYCPYCSGQVALKPCPNYCLNVLHGCLANQADLDSEWNNYLDAMLGMADRLGGPFNFESIVEPIDVKLSDAIMNMQENSMQVSQKVFQGCGQPKLAAVVRSSRSIKDGSFPGRFRPYTPDAMPTTAAGTNLHRLVTDVKKKLKAAKKFWSTLPEKVCVGDRVAQEDECWNGTAKSRYESVVMGSGLANQASNPEVEVDVTMPDTLIRRQIVVLKDMTTRLKAAHSGDDITVETDEDGGSGEESGSGSDSPSCTDDRDIYIATAAPHKPVVPRLHEVKTEGERQGSAGSERRGSGALALVALALALLLPLWR